MHAFYLLYYHCNVVCEFSYSVRSSMLHCVYVCFHFTMFQNNEQRAFSKIKHCNWPIHPLYCSVITLVRSLPDPRTVLHINSAWPVAQYILNSIPKKVGKPAAAKTVVKDAVPSTSKTPSPFPTAEVA